MVTIQADADAFQFTSSFCNDSTPANGDNCLNPTSKEEKLPVVTLDLVKTSWFALYSSGNARQIDTPKPTTASPTTSILSRDSVLGNHDLLEFIFSFLQVDYNIEELEYEDPEMKVKRGTLLKAALTCRGFRQPGLQVLWRVIDTFDPLLSLLPDYDNDRSIVGVIQPEEFQLFDKYAPFVRHFRALSNAPSLKWYEWIFMLISRYHPSPIFPCLQTTFIETTSSSSIEGHRTSLFLPCSSTLRAFMVKKFSQGDQALVSNLLMNIFFSSPTLQKISLSGYIGTRIIDVIGRFTKLNSLRLGFNEVSVGCSILGKLSALPLRHLALEMINHPKFSSNWKEPHPVFPHLDSLVMEGDPANIERILDILEAPQLKKTTLRFHAASNQDITPVLTSCLQRLVGIAEHSLEDVSLNLQKSPLKGRAWGFLNPLRKCHLLRSFEFTCGTMAFEDDDLLSMCSQGEWRNLEVLKVLPSSVKEGDRTLSLDALRILGHQCPKLISLSTNVSIPCDPLDVAMLQDNVVYGPNHGLQQLSLIDLTGGRVDGDESQFVDHVKVGMQLARYIDRIFPNLKRLDIASSKIED